MKRNSKIKNFISKIFNIYKCDGEFVFVIFGIKMKFKAPTLNRLEDVCIIPQLKELLEKNTYFPHPIGIVINKHAKIGKNCVIFQNVTIGDSMSAQGVAKYPTIEDNVVICANAVVIGDVTVGENSLIGASSVVVKNVPPNSVVAGNPARIIREKIKS